jgi:hypothetical protein
MPAIRAIFKALPKPKYLKVKINIIPSDIKKPRRLFENIIEKVKKSAINKTNNNNGRAQGV